MDEEMVTITKASYDRLQEADAFLDALEAAGVDNWDGYAMARDILNEDT